MFIEESPPIPLAEMFGLMDFDSSDVTAIPFTVVVTIIDAADGMEIEGLLFDVTGTDVTVSPPAEQGRFAFSYTLEGSNNYSMYQSVSSSNAASSLLHGFLPHLHFDFPFSEFHQFSSSWHSIILLQGYQ